MSPPEVWGPPIWTLFHTLIERINERYYHLIYQQLFNIIKQICTYLPCPECSTDAVIFLSKVKIQTLNIVLGYCIFYSSIIYSIKWKIKQMN
jgi:hypothetical protein